MTAATLLAALFVLVVITEANGSAARLRARVYAGTYRAVTGQSPSDNPYEERS